MGLVIAGFVLTSIPWIEIAQPHGSDAFLLIQCHFILTGLVSIWGASVNERSLVASFSLIAVGVNGWFTYLALTSGDVSLYWPIIFGFASAINLAYLLKTDIPEEPKQDIEQLAKKGELGLVTPGFGVVSAGAILTQGLKKIVGMMLVLFAVMLILTLGVIYFVLLQKAIFEKAAISFREVYIRFSGEVGKEILFETSLYIFIMAGVFGAYYLLEAFAHAMSRARDAKAVSDVDREFSLDERHYISDALAGLLVYLEGKKFPQRWRILYLVGWLFFFAAMLAAPFAVFILEAAAGGILAEVRGIDNNPLHYSGPFYFGGVSAAFILGPSLVWSLCQIAGSRFPGFAEYLYARVGWNSMRGGQRQPGDYLKSIARHVRTRRLNIDQPFAPGDFLTAAFREHEHVVHKVSVAFILLTAILTAADLARFELVDNRGVIYSKYFNFQTRYAPFKDIDRIEIRCVLYDPDDDGERKFGFEYILVKDGEFRINLIKNEEFDGAFSRIEALDDQLSDLKIPVVPADNAGFILWTWPGVTPQCGDEIDERYEPGRATRLKKLLRINSTS